MKLVVIAKSPEPGTSKTRLCPPCTPEEAAEIAKAALLDTLDAVAATPCEERVVVLAGEPDGWLRDGFRVVPQRGRGLDERLAAAFEDAGTPAVVIGMDTPQVTPALLRDSLERLALTDAVLGPAVDGGYWAIGLREADPRALIGVPMSTPRTGKAQRERLETLGLEVGDLPPLRDVDTYDDALAVAVETPGSRFASAVERVVRGSAGEQARSSGRRVALLLAGLASLIVVWYGLGRWLSLVADVRIWTMSPPLTGVIDPTISWRVLPVLALGGVAVAAWGPRVARSSSWRVLLWASFAAAAAWGAGLAFTDGSHGFLGAPSNPDDYLGSLSFVAGDPVGFLRSFVGSIAEYGTHARSHPPGMLVILFGMDRAGLGGPGWFAALQMLGAGAAVYWSSGDAFFLGVSSWAVALLVLSTGAVGRRSFALALAGGVLFGVVAFLSYGLVLLALVPALVAWRRGRLEVLALAAIPLAVMALIFGMLGFWWWEGLAASKHQYDIFVTRTRPYWYFLVANPLAFALALGPAVVGLAASPRDAGVRPLVASPRDAGVWPLVAGGLAATLLANLSGLSKGEVERIWLSFVPWVAVATAAYVSRSDREVRGWLGAQVGTALALQTLLRSPW